MVLPPGSPAQHHQPQGTALRPCSCCIRLHPVPTDLSLFPLNPKGHRHRFPSPTARKQGLMVPQPLGPQPAVPRAPHLLGGRAAEQGRAKLTLPGSVASPALAASCNNHHGKRKCCTMTWGERSLIASSSEGRTAPSSSSAHHPGTSIPHSPVPQWLLVLLEPGALAVFPGLNRESHHLNVPLRVGGAAWSGNTLLPLQVLLGQLNFCHHCHQQNRCQQPHASSTTLAGFYCPPGWDLGQARAGEGCGMCLHSWKKTQSVEKSHAS